jgi:hypothetical protein
LPEQVLLEDPSIVLAVLANYVPASRFFAGISCFFGHLPARSEYPQVKVVVGAHCILVNGLIVSRARTQARSARATELALETLPQYRRLGYGRQVAAAWGSKIYSQGKVAFYSYRMENLASAALARGLGVIQFTRFTSYSLTAKR